MTGAALCSVYFIPVRKDPKTYATDDIISPFEPWGKGETRGWDHDGMKRFEEGVSDEVQCMKKGGL